MRISADAELAGVDRGRLAGAVDASVRLEGATIDGIAVTDLLAYWRAGHGSKSA
jgi:hypothetical protein